MLLHSVVCGSKMQVGIKSIIFVLWMCSFAQAQRECLRNEIQFANILRFSLDERYEWGDSVRVNCATGYVGFLKLTCTNEGWRQTGGRECKKRPCGHPGDTPNGDFTLKGETEFVFGAVVEYHCRKGYVMTSRVNRRNCLSQGWDNSVPVCEEVKCPTIKATGDVIASGNTEDASFEEVIHFECASSHKMLDGPETIHCTEHGTWSASVPKCKEISCQPPNINHGTISNFMEQYKENELIKYSCLGGFKPRPGVSKCTKYGWSIQPDCEEIICMLGPPTREVARTLPLGKNIFKMRDTVEVICSDGYRVIGTKVQSKVIMCGENGNWENTPTCEDITCEVPHGQHVYYPHYYFSYERRLGISRSYRCEAGYQQAAREATCQVDGWHPNPLCIKISCQPPNINNGMVANLKEQYKENELIKYSCQDGFKPRTGVPKCTKYGWSIQPECEEIICMLGPPTRGVARTLPLGKNIFKMRDTVEVICSDGYRVIGTKVQSKVIMCGENGNWENTPTCEDISCEVPYGQHVYYPHYYFRHERRLGISRSYRCEAGYRQAAREATCQVDGWHPNPLCIIPSVCSRPPTHGFATPKHLEDGSYSSGASVEYACPVYYVMDGDSHLTCEEGRWTGNVTCLKPCILTIEAMDARHIQQYHIEKKPMYPKHNEYVTFKCQSQRRSRPGSPQFRQKCVDGRMDLPICH